MSFLVFVIHISELCTNVFGFVNPILIIRFLLYFSFILLSTETFVSTATYNLASITVPYATYGCQTRNIPTTVPTVDSVVSAGARTFVTVKIVECASTNNSSPVITVRLASI